MANKLKQKYIQKDSSGVFVFTRETGLSSDKNEFVVKGQLEAKSKIVEKAISISTLEKKLLVPKLTQFSVWINKEKHFSEIEFDAPTNQLIIKLISSDLKNNGVKFFPLPKNQENLCFFSQIIECAHIGGLFEKAKDEKKPVNLNVIWDGFPFFHQLFQGFTPKLLSPATLEYEAKTLKGHKRFILKVEGDPIIYEIDKEDGLLKRNWFSKNVTIEKMGDTF